MEKLELSEVAKQLRREYARQWRQKNPDKVRAATQRYWENQAARQITSRVTEMRDAGLSYRDIAESTGLNHMKVKRILDNK